MLISHAILAPHLPTLILDQHRGHRTEMLEALAHAAERLHADSPAAIVALSARWETSGSFLVGVGKRHATITDYTGLGVEVRYDCNGHPALARALVEAGRKAGVHVGPATRGVDSGVSVPMHFLVPSRDLPLVPLSLAKRSAAECRQWGKLVRDVLAAWPERVAFVVGGVLSNNEHAWSLKREVPETGTLDRAVIDSLVHGEWDQLAAAGRDVIQKAQPEAGLRHLEVLRGFLGAEAKGELFCYESGPGVGAALIGFPVTEEIGSRPGGAAE